MENSILKPLDETALASFCLPGEPEGLQKVRLSARKAFSGQLWPDKRNEEWRRTSLSRMDLSGLRVVRPAPVEIEPSAPPQGFSGHMIFRDGQLSAFGLSQELLARGVVWSELASGWSRAETFLKEVFPAVPSHEDRFASWHHCLIGPAALFTVPDRLEIEEPFLIEFHDDRQDVLVTPHLAVKIGNQARATLVVRQASTERSRIVCNAGADYRIGEAADFRLIEIQTLGGLCQHIDHSSLRQGRDSRVYHLNVSVGADLVKTKFEFSLDGPGSELRTNGIYFGTDDQHKDIRVVQNHEAPNAQSFALYKGAVKDRARTVFQGLIEVKPAGAKTDAYLSNKNLILNDGARADSLPQLRIDTNDVKCSHGSTTGRVNEDEVFYLMARGFSRAESRLLIAEGLFSELIDKAPEFLREELEFIVEKAIGG